MYERNHLKLVKVMVIYDILKHDIGSTWRYFSKSFDFNKTKIGANRNQSLAELSQKLYIKIFAQIIHIYIFIRFQTETHRVIFLLLAYFPNSQLELIGP